MSLCSYEFDNTFGPIVASCRRKFDFTQLFEESIFGVGLSGASLLLALLRIWQVTGRTRRVRVDWLWLYKLIALAGIGVLELVLVVLWAVQPPIRKTKATIAAAALMFCSAVIFLPLSNAEHLTSVRPSAAINIVLLLFIAADAIRLRTYWLLNENLAILIIFSLVIAVRLVALFLEARSKRKILRGDDKNRPLEETAGIFSIATWIWLSPLLVQAYRKGLHAVSELAAIDRRLLDLSWETNPVQNKRNNSRSRSHSFLLATARRLKAPLMKPIIARLGMTIFTYSQPLLLIKTVQFIDNPGNPDYVGYGLIGAYAIVYTGIAVSTAQYWQGVNRFLTSTRAILITTIFKQSIEPVADVEETTDPLTLMGSDVQRIVLGLKFIHEAWAGLLEAGLACYLLKQQVGILAIAPVLIALCCVGISWRLSWISGARQKLWFEAIERRLQFTVRVLGSTKEVKMLGLSKTAQECIRGLRLQEIDIARWYRHISVMSVVLSYVTLTVSPIVTLGALCFSKHSHGRTINVSTVFTTITLINLLATPLMTFLQSLPRLSAAFAGFSRIQTYLEIRVREDRRTLCETIRDDSLDSKKTYGYELTEIGCDSINKHYTKDKFSIEPGLRDSSIALHLNNASFRWQHYGRSVLSNITINAERGSLVMIVGPIGCGKSTLLKGILGECSCIAGSVQLQSPRIAFADQNPWLVNASVRENIVGPTQSYHCEERYKRVVRACALNPDVNTDVSGEEGVVGAMGNNLSGGQKQRIALARAVYARVPLTLLDDPFSGLDRITEQRIFEATCGAHGLLRQAGSTIILVTHSVRLLQHADHVVALDSSGFIVEQGQFQELKSRNGYVNRLWTKQKSPHENETQADVASELRRSEKGLTDGRRVHVPNLKSAESSQLSIYKYYFASIGRWRMILFFCLALLFVFFLRFPSLWLSWWTGAPERTRNNALYFGVFAALQFGALMTMGVWIWSYLDRAVAASGKFFHEQLLGTVIRAPMSFHRNTDPGISTNRFSQDIQLIDQELPMALHNVAELVPSCLFQIVLIAIDSYWLFALFPFIFAALYFLQRFYLRTSRPLRVLEIEAKSPLYTHFIETIQGVITLRAFGWQHHMLDRNKRLLDESQKPFYLLLSVQAWLNFFLDMLVAILAVIVVGLAVGLRHKTQAGTLGLALLNIATIGDTLRQLLLEWTMLETSLGAVTRIKTFVESVDSETNEGPQELPPSGAWPSQGHVQFKNVSACYDTAEGSESQPALTNIDLDFVPGSKVGICGESGSGKSTLVQCLFKFLYLSQGAIEIDGVDIANIQHDLLRSSVNVIPQSPFFLHGSVRFNLDPQQQAADEALWSVLGKVQLAHLIREEGGLDIPLRDSMLSNGQRQLLCLARALLKKSKLLVLDEISSSVDLDTEKLIHKIIDSEFTGSTILQIAHRLEAIVDSDLVVVLRDGAVVEIGAPSELLERPAGFFKDLWNSKSSG